MNQQDKKLLFQDLCARLPYGVICHIENDSDFEDILQPYDGKISFGLLDRFRGHQFDLKPYLRSMSNMTKEEKEYIQQRIDIVEDENYGDSYSPSAWDAMSDFTHYCYERHLDVNGLISKGLALEAPEGMYN